MTKTTQDYIDEHVTLTNCGDLWLPEPGADEMLAELVERVRVFCAEVR